MGRTQAKGVLVFGGFVLALAGILAASQYVDTHLRLLMRVQELTTDVADTSAEPMNEYPMASPDGRYLLYDHAEGPGVEDTLEDDTEQADVDTAPWKIYRLSLGGIERRCLTQGNARESEGVWSPDGKTIAYRLFVNGQFDIYLMDADGGNKRPLVANPAYDEKTPAFSPDGKSVAYYSDQDGTNRYNLCSIDLETREVRLLTEGKVKDQHPQFAPDGHEIVFHSNRDAIEVALVHGHVRLRQIFLLDMTGGSVRPLTTTTLHDPVDARHPVVSPDGRFVVYHAESYRRPNEKNFYLKRERDLMVVTLDGRRSINLTENDPRSFKHPSWSPSGDRIYFAFKEQHGGAWNIGTMAVRPALRRLD